MHSLADEGSKKTVKKSVKPATSVKQVWFVRVCFLLVYLKAHDGFMQTSPSTATAMCQLWPCCPPQKPLAEQDW